MRGVSGKNAKFRAYFCVYRVKEGRSDRGDFPPLFSIFCRNLDPCNDKACKSVDTALMGC